VREPLCSQTPLVGGERLSEQPKRFRIGRLVIPADLSDFAPKGHSNLSRRDDRTQPGVLTPGKRVRIDPPSQGAEDISDRAFVRSA
jgi:hypothetical protein